MLEFQVARTAGHLNGADLLVQGIVLEIHWTSKNKRYSDRIKHASFWVNSEQYIRHDDFVKVAFLLVFEEKIRPPNSIGIGEHEVADLATHVVELEPVVYPLLSKGHLDRVFLRANANKHI